MCSWGRGKVEVMSWLEKWEVRESGLRERERGRKEEVGHSEKEAKKQTREKQREKREVLGRKTYGKERKKWILACKT